MHALMLIKLQSYACQATSSDEEWCLVPPEASRLVLPTVNSTAAHPKHSRQHLRVLSLKPTCCDTQKERSVASFAIDHDNLSAPLSPELKAALTAGEVNRLFAPGTPVV